MRRLWLLLLITACAISLSACKTMCPGSKEKGEVKKTDAKTDTRTVFQKLDGPDNDNVITEEELQAQRKVWLNKLDINGDGKLTKDEFVETGFVRIDVLDADGQITEEEYMTFIAGPDAAVLWEKAESKEQPGSCFKAMDQNADGKITYEEFIIHRKGWFNTVDADNNGKISKAEFKKMRKKEHALRDADKDDALIVDEFIVPSPAMPEKAAKKEKKKDK